jgi:lactoylglutathione lyase
MSESPAKDLTLSVHHTMLPVMDMDRSINFYTRCLGMHVGDRHANQIKKTEVALVGYGGTWLELTRDAGESAPPTIAPTGIHVGVDVDDLPRYCERLEREGVTFISALKPSSDGRALRAWIADPDGHQLELRG